MRTLERTCRHAIDNYFMKTNLFKKAMSFQYREKYVWKTFIDVSDTVGSLNTVSVPEKSPKSSLRQVFCVSILYLYVPYTFGRILETRHT